MGLTEIVSTNRCVKTAHHSRESSTSSTASNGGAVVVVGGSNGSINSSDWESTIPCYSGNASAAKSNELALNPRALGQNCDQQHVTAGGAATLMELEKTLDETRLELERSQAEVERLGRIRDDVEAEVRELTASLFQEAHAMVREANVKAAAAEKAFKEARMQVDVLQAEVDALKTLVLTSTPSQPNPHLHPQLAQSSSNSSTASNGSIGPSTPPKSNGLKMFTRHRRGASDCDLKYVGAPDAAPAAGSTAGDNAVTCASASSSSSSADAADREVDPIFYSEFLAWRQSPSLTKNSRFVERLFNEDADRCLDFPNEDLSPKVRQAVDNNCVFIEEFHSQSPMWCSLLNTQRVCRYRMKLADEDQWYPISTLCRNRITAVCDMFTYLRYIQLGLVKSGVQDVYWEIIRLRKQMTLARLGLC